METSEEFNSRACCKCNKPIPSDARYCPYCAADQRPPARKTKSRGNGQGSVYKRGSTWVAQRTVYYGEERKRVRVGGFKTKKEALCHLSGLTPHDKPVSTIHSLYDTYSNGKLTKLSKSKQVAYAIAYGRLLSIDEYRITELTVRDLQRVVDQNTETYYTARDMKRLLSHLYKIACAQQEVASNLSAYIALPDLDEEEPEPFSENELHALWADY